MLAWFHDYRPEWLRPDLLAGLITAAVVIPKAMAYATVAGLPVQVGLYTAFVPMVIYAVLGSCRVLSVSTTTTIAILTGAALADVAPDGNLALILPALVTLTLLVGLLLVLGSLLRLGFLANFISEPVLIGFKAGIGLVIIVDQLPKLFGLHFPKGTFGQNVLSLVQNLPETAVVTLAVGGLTMLLLVGMERFLPRLPAPLFGLGAGIAAMGLLGLGAMGVESIGQIPRGLPGLQWPDLSMAAALWPAAMGIAVMSFTETVAVGRAFAAPGEPAMQPNRELLATGLATAGGALIGGMPAGGGASQTAVNRLSGAHSPLAGVVTAGVALLTMLLLAPVMSLMPQATLAAVVIVYSVGLIQPAEFRAILTVRRNEFIWALAALFGVVTLGTLKGILVAIIVSMVGLAQQVANPPVYVLGRKRGTNAFRPLSPEHTDDETFPGLLMLRLTGRLFFANAERVGDRLRPLVEEARPRVVALDLSGVFDLEYTALKMLTEGELRQRERGIELWLVGLTPDVLQIVQRAPLGRALGDGRMFFNMEDAVAKYQALPAATA